jgi:hypothetical protein
MISNAYLNISVRIHKMVLFAVVLIAHAIPVSHVIDTQEMIFDFPF